MTLPADLTPNICDEDEEISNCPEDVITTKVVNNPPRRKSPGGDRRKREKKFAEENKLTTSNHQSGFLFNFKDPVWKPLSELDGLNPDWSK